MMSFALTEPQLMDGSKTVTRRTGWQNLKPGTRLLAVRKAMGLKAGEKVQPLCEIEITSVRRERIDVITPAEVLAEGFPHWTNQVGEFVAMFCRHMNVKPENEVTRIEFRKVPGSECVAVQMPLV
jgi:hypothetical protein